MTAPGPPAGVAEVIARIRAEAERRRRIEGELRGSGVEEPFPARRKYALSEFLALEDEQFVRAAYQGLLRRMPESAELVAGLNQLQTGRDAKIELLVGLHRSPEGRRLAVKVSDLNRHRRLGRLRRLPVLGPVLAWAAAWDRGA